MLKFNKLVLLFSAVILLASNMLPAEENRQIGLSAPSNQVTISNNGDHGFEVQIRISNLRLREVITKEGLFDELIIDGFGFSNVIGDPKLPFLRKLIAVPLGAEVRFRITDKSQHELSETENQLLHRIIPAQEPVSKSADPANLPFAYNVESYRRNDYDQTAEIQLSELGYLRGIRLFALDFYPIHYNPGTNSISVIEDCKVEVEFVNPDLISTADYLAKTASAEFDRLYQKMILNWRGENRDPATSPTKILILAPTAYLDELQPFVQWKIEQGFNVVLLPVVDNTTTAIQAIMNDIWNAATPSDPAPSYLIIVGDHEATGDNIVANIGSTGTHVTDLNYVRLRGNDFLPEMYYGRISVSSAAELANVINKTLQYEQSAMPDPDYLGEAVLIAGVDGYYGPRHANGAVRYGNELYFNADNDIQADVYLYPESQDHAADIVSGASEGRGFLYYTAHGHELGWANPAFTVSDVANLNNQDKYFAAIGNCCRSNKFNYSSPCFGEALIRAENKAAVSYIGANNLSYWYEDFYWMVGLKNRFDGFAPPYEASALGAFDRMFHTHGEAVSEWAQSNGEIVVWGNSAVLQSGSDLSNYYWEIYSIMGDPSLMPYYGVPIENAANYPHHIRLGQTTITVAAEPQSRVALSQDGVLYAAAVIDNSGVATLGFSPFTSTGTARLVITRSNRRSIIEEIQIIPDVGAYLYVGTFSYTDSNNGIPEYNETGGIDFVLQNVGAEMAANIIVSISCSGDLVALIDSTESVVSLNADSQLTVNNAFTFSIADNVANGSCVNFNLTLTCGRQTWQQQMTLTLNAPSFVLGDFLVTELSGNENRRIDPGETVLMQISLSNSGGAASQPGMVTLSSPTPLITIASPTQNLAALGSGDSVMLGFQVSADRVLPVGTMVCFTLDVVAGAYSACQSDSSIAGLLIENFESGDFGEFFWFLDGPPFWTIDSAIAHDGSYSARSGAVQNNEQNRITIWRQLSAPGTISFWFKVSSESGNDVFSFLVDGVLQQSWSGEIDWMQATFPLAAGLRTLRWVYAKNESLDSGADCAWLDDIIFPASINVNVANFVHDLIAIPSHQSVRLEWQQPYSTPPNAYRIERDGVFLINTISLNYTDYAVSNGTTYCYCVSAIYASGLSDPGVVYATPNALPPLNPTAEAGNGYVNLSWSAGSGREGNGDRNISGYNVYRDGSVIVTVADTSYIDVAVINENTYSYYVTTVYSNPTGESAPSDTLYATPTAITSFPVIIGSGSLATNGVTASPINIFYTSLHGQAVYTAAELNSAGVFGPLPITRLGFYIESAPAVRLNSFIIRMKHTTATNVESWQSADSMQLVYSTAYYMPVAGGFQQLELTEPFTWNGVDNLVVDTAFNNSISHNSGTVRYSEVAYGYRYIRADGINQTNVFSGGYSSDQRPNIQFTFQQNLSSPFIVVSPTTLDFGDVPLGSVSFSIPFSIQNLGAQTLSGIISVPPDYQVTEAGSNNLRPVFLEFSVPPFEDLIFDAYYTPLSLPSTDSFITISSNAGNSVPISLAVQGNAYIPPTLALSSDSVSITLDQGQQGTATFSLSNEGTWDLNYSLGVSDLNPARKPGSALIDKTASGRNIDGSSLTLNADHYSSGSTVDWVFTVHNGSTDDEWIKDIWISFPPGVTINQASAFLGINAELIPDQDSGSGITIHWLGTSIGGWGVIQSGQNATATVNVSLAAWFGGDLSLPYQLGGDGYGIAPHLISGEITLLQTAPALDWLSLSPFSGVLEPGESQVITCHFTAQGLGVGMQNAMISVFSNDPLSPQSIVSATLQVNAVNQAPAFDPPDSLQFTVNGSLEVDFNAYATDPEGDMLSLSCSGNLNVYVDIIGLEVSFTGAANWTGTELLNFQVSDGLNYSGASVSVSVLPPPMPDWIPVSYPNPPAFIQANVYVESAEAGLNDVVAAFCGDECRGFGFVNFVNNLPTVQLSVNLSSDPEQVTLKVYSQVLSLTGEVPGSFELSFGEDLGVPTPVVINAIVYPWLDAPVVTSFISPNGFVLQWDPVTNAHQYRVYRASAPEGPYTLLAMVSSLQYIDAITTEKAFYYVSAVRNQLFRDYAR